MPEGTAAILNARSLETSHRRLAELLRPGLRVLDVGCGTGAITSGIAHAVAPRGRVVGVDVNPDLVAEACRLHGRVPGLSFQVADAWSLPFHEAFDIVTAARLLQWLAQPGDAVRALARAARPGGRLVVLDYNHEKIAWTPPPPPSVQAFYAAFLKWRTDAGMDNAIADHMAALFAQAGLQKVAVTPQHETTRRGEPGFETQAGIWADVAATRGCQMVEDGVIAEADRAGAETDYRAWIRHGAEVQTMYLLAVESVRP